MTHLQFSYFMEKEKSRYMLVTFRPPGEIASQFSDANALRKGEILHQNVKWLVFGLYVMSPLMSVGRVTIIAFLVRSDSASGSGILSPLGVTHTKSNDPRNSENRRCPSPEAMTRQDEELIHNQATYWSASWQLWERSSTVESLAKTESEISGDPGIAIRVVNVACECLMETARASKRVMNRKYTLSARPLESTRTTQAHWSVWNRISCFPSWHIRVFLIKFAE
jgi:hypothetical protein